MTLKYISSFIIIFLSVQNSFANVKKIHYEDLTSIVIKAEKFIENSSIEAPYPPVISIKPISKRMKLAQCDANINIEFSSIHKTSGNTLLKVSCN